MIPTAIQKTFSITMSKVLMGSMSLLDKLATVPSLRLDRSN